MHIINYMYVYTYIHTMYIHILHIIYIYTYFLLFLSCAHYIDDIYIYIYTSGDYIHPKLYIISSKITCASTERISGVPADLFCPHNQFLGSQQISCAHIIHF